MERYATPGAFRAALEQRLNDRAKDSGTEIYRLRRRVVFERLLARLEKANPGEWVVKGAMALEIRDTERSRRTKDLDLATRNDTDNLQDLLTEALSLDPFEDYFRFLVSEPTAMATDQAGPPAWRFAIEVALDTRRFERVKLDVVQRVEEIAATIRIPYPSLVGFADLPQVEVEIVEPRQHFAEKLHAYTRDYGTRPNTRVKDLPDMVLLVEGGLEADKSLYEVVGHVFATRASQSIPDHFPDPPPGWDEEYEELARDLDDLPRTLGGAVPVVREFWAKTVAAAKE